MKRLCESVGKQGFYLIVLFALVAQIGCSRFRWPGNIPASTLQIEATVEASISEAGAERAVVSVKFTNIGSVPVAVCRCFGVADQWITFEVTKPDGSPVDLEAPDWDLFSPPPYSCLAPGQSFTIQKDLFHWYAQFGTVLYEWGADSYSLMPGDYRLRASYLDVGGTKDLRCASLQGESHSQWVSFATKIKH